MRQIQISDSIRRYRSENNITQTDFGALFGVTAQTVSKWEREVCCPDISLLSDLADTMGISISELLYGSAAKE